MIIQPPKNLTLLNRLYRLKGDYFFTRLAISQEIQEFFSFANTIIHINRRQFYTLKHLKKVIKNNFLFS